MTRLHPWMPLAIVALAVHMSGKILTPNGDGINDNIAFTLPSIQLRTPRAQVFDVRGRRVAELQPASPTELRWDGRDSGGRTVQSGLYLVQITDDDGLWNGVLAVAK